MSDMRPRIQTPKRTGGDGVPEVFCSDEQSGIEVDLVSRGDEAVDVFRNNPPDLVLLDIMLPGLDGIEVEHAIIDRGNGEFTSMLKSTYDEMIAAQGQTATI